MKRIVLASLTAITLTPMAASALPALGDILGTNPDEATAALKAAGCDLQAFEAEDGQIEAKCTDVATAKMVEIYIDPKTGAVTNIKMDD